MDTIRVLALLAGGVTSQRMVMLVQEYGIDFEPTGEYLDVLWLCQPGLAPFDHLIWPHLSY
jgi:hypothetical protein